MNYEIFGDFTVPRKPRRNAVAETVERRVFWRAIDDAHPGLSSAVGCYVFAIRAGRGILPWYVGKTCTQGFSGECFEPHKLVHYNDIISSRKQGTPLLYFLARMTPGGKFSASMPGNEAKFLESMLIGMALQRNKDLKNIVHTKFLQQLRVPGLVNAATKGPPPRGTPPCPGPRRMHGSPAHGRSRSARPHSRRRLACCIPHRPSHRAVVDRCPGRDMRRA